MSKAKSYGKTRPASAVKAVNKQAPGKDARQATAPPTVSARWLLGGIAVALVAALVCAWGTLCILFWQGSWQLLYHPTSAVTRTPASVNLPFESVGFATIASGEPQLHGWWIPASHARYTAIFLHGETGNIGDAVDFLVPLHAAGLNLFALDYRGYGQSHFVHPSEARLREDANSAIGYLTNTRHIPIGSIILVGRDLGANLALEVAAAHPDLGGVVLQAPLESPTSAIFNDPRARLVPARLLVSDRWDTSGAASNLLIPSLWFYWAPAGTDIAAEDKPPVFERVQARKMLVWLTGSRQEAAQFGSALSTWLDQLQAASR